MPDGAGEAFTLLTTEPSPDVAPIHDRQMVILDRANWLAWLDLTLLETELLRPLTAGLWRSSKYGDQVEHRYRSQVDSGSLGIRPIILLERARCEAAGASELFLWAPLSQQQ